MGSLECSQTVFGVPKSHTHCNFENYRWPSPGIQGAVLEFTGRLLQKEKSNLLVTGTPGLGKTHLSVALYRWGVLHLGGTGECTFVHVPTFFNKVKGSFARVNDFQVAAEDPFEEVANARGLVVLDDILGRNPSPWEVENVIFRLINDAYNNGAALVVTSNYSPEQLASTLRPHEMSRLLERTVHLSFQGDDARLG